MYRWSRRSTAAAAVVLCACIANATVPGAHAATSAVVPVPAFASPLGPPGGATAVVAARAFLDTLSAEEAALAVLAFDSPLRANWSNLPAGILRFARNGLRLGDLAPHQLEALFGFLAAALGRHGYDTVADIVSADAVLADAPRAKRFAWSAENYWLAFFGEPSLESAWGLQFGGHHLAVNATLVNGQIVSLSPIFLGVEPASYSFDGTERAPLADELADALALVVSLPGDLRTSALVAERPREVHAGPGRDGELPPVEGSAVAQWPERAREALLALVSHWVHLQPEENAAVRMHAVERDLDRTRFAWHGPFDGSRDVYFRIQGPSLIVEFSTEGGIGSRAGHFHSVYRDPSNEYGARSAR